MKKFLILFFSVILCSSMLFSGVCLADESSDTAESIQTDSDPSSSEETSASMAVHRRGHGSDDRQGTLF